MSVQSEVILYIHKVNPRCLQKQLYDDIFVISILDFRKFGILTQANAQ